MTEDKVKLHISCHGDCATITRESLDEVDPRIELSEEDKARGYVEFIEVKITGTFYEDEELPKVCPICKGNPISYGISNIPRAKVIGPLGAISTADMVPGIRALMKAVHPDYPCPKCGSPMNDIWSCYNCYVPNGEWEKLIKEKEDKEK